MTTPETAAPKARGPRPKIRQADIVRLAAEMFRERGYAGTTMRDLAMEVGISSGSLFHHFGSKEEILLCVVKEGLRGTIELIEQKCALVHSPRERLTAMIEGHLSALLEGSPETRSVLFYEWWSLTGEGKQAIVKSRDAYEKLWDTAIKEAVGDTLDRTERRVRRLLLLGAMNWSTQWYRANGKMTINDIASLLVETHFGST